MGLPVPPMPPASGDPVPPIPPAATPALPAAGGTACRSRRTGRTVWFRRGRCGRGGARYRRCRRPVRRSTQTGAAVAGRKKRRDKEGSALKAQRILWGAVVGAQNLRAAGDTAIAGWRLRPALGLQCFAACITERGRPRVAQGGDLFGRQFGVDAAFEPGRSAQDVVRGGAGVVADVMTVVGELSSSPGGDERR